MTDTLDPSLRGLLQITRDGRRVGDDAPLDARSVVWPSPPLAARPLPRGWVAQRVDALRVALPDGFTAGDVSSDGAGTTATFFRRDVEPVAAPLVLVRSVIRAVQPFIGEANQMAARFTHQLGCPASQQLRPVEVPRSPRAVMGAWEWLKHDGLPTRSTVALVDGEDGERYTVQLNGAATHLPDTLVAAFYAALSIGLLNDAW